MAHSLMVCTVDIHQLASIVRNRIDNALILDSRSFLEYNASHVVNAINVGCAKLMKRRLQQDKLSIEDFLAQNCHWNVDRNIDIIVYDQSTCDPKRLPPDSFMGVFLQKLLPVYNSVNLLKGGFLEFQAAYPDLCEDERSNFAPLTSLSQPCLPISNHGPTRILPYLYLGSQNDALNQEVLQHHNITYQLNVSTNCPKPDFIQDSHFMRIPVIDNYSEKLLPHFHNAFQFLDKARESGCCVLIHCLAGISRSATIAIAYVMKSLRMTSDEAYRYVKAKRTNVSPNFNFLGQLLEYEKQLQRELVLVMNSESSATPIFNSSSPISNPSYNKSYLCDFMEETTMYSNQEHINNSYCPKYADEAEPMPCRTSREKDSSLSFKKSTSACTFKYIPCKAALNIKSLPVSSLKDLNFTPCQTSALIQRGDKMFTKDKKNCTSPTVLVSPVSPKRLEGKGNSSALELHLENSRGSIMISSDVITPGDLKAFEFDSKAYNRSDSVSTSGLGSEGSDCADSWNDFTSSCERETDISMDDDYPSVPSDDRMMRHSKLGNDPDRFEDSFEESLSFYPKCERFSANLKLRTEYAQIVPTVKFDSSKYEEDNSPLNSDSPDFSKTQLLYRAQSCPVMLSSDISETSTSSGNVKLRNSKTKLTEDKCRNRFSCSSIDYMDYSHALVLNHESCPETIHLETGPKNSSISSSSSHCNYRHSMIQVS